MAKKIVKLMGGLGNQMFQYAFVYAVAKNFNAEILLDFSWFEEVKEDPNVTTRKFELDAFNIDYRIATKEDLNALKCPDKRSKMQKRLWKIFKIKKFRPAGHKFVQRKAYSFDKNLLEDSYYVDYEGYFQNEKYFIENREKIIKLFSPKEELDEKNQSVLSLIKSANSISLHVRRGDYVSLDSASKFHGTCSLEYYQNAINYIVERVKNPHFFLFSDDIAWVSENLKINYPYTVISFNQGKGAMDLELMKHCKHNIIANSSFSWWGAWLNENPEKIVIAPEKWTLEKQKDSLVPNEWVKL